MRLTSPLKTYSLLNLFTLLKYVSPRLQKLHLKGQPRAVSTSILSFWGKNLSNNPSSNTIKAFENFNFTFLVHSSLEKDKPIAINWLEELGFTSENLLRSRVFRK